MLFSAIRTSLIEAIEASDEMSDVPEGKPVVRWEQIKHFMCSHEYMLVRYRERWHWVYWLADEQQNS